MAKIWHIAINTFREASRDRVLYVIAFFACLMMLASTALGWISAADQAQVVTHFSLAVTSFFSALIAVFVGTNLIHKEIEKRTIYTILSK
ncbi:MAG: ABC transporter permease, partial [Planctomycetota bacterium]|nr:ABC transporter permease [Planctomycetota bacterium]